MIELCFPTETQLKIDDVQIQSEKIDVYARRCNVSASCPDCEQTSQKLHSHYQRHPYDLPCFGNRVQLHLNVRCFFCQHQTCSRRTFAETFPELVSYKARRTQRLNQQQVAIAFTVSGEAGARLLPLLGMPLSGDPLIREIRRMPDGEVKSPRVLGIDDWAKKRGQTYGTILVDLESRQPIDVLDSREVDDVVHWLKQHPGVEIISRDRSLEYKQGIDDDAPQAVQVADRWHLLKNLMEVTERTLLEIYPQLKERMNTQLQSPSGLRDKFPRGRADELKRAENRRKRMQRYEYVHYLRAQGFSTRRIAKILNISRGVVIRFIRAETYPERKQYPTKPSQLDPYLPFLEAQFQKSDVTAKQLWVQIQAKGYPGAMGQVVKWLKWRRRSGQEHLNTQSAKISTVYFMLPTIKELTRLINSNPEQLESDELWRLQRLAQIPKINQTLILIRQFSQMVMTKDLASFDAWFTTCKGSDIGAFKRFAKGIEQDLHAVKAAIYMPWSNELAAYCTSSSF